MAVRQVLSAVSQAYLPERPMGIWVRCSIRQCRPVSSPTPCRNAAASVAPRGSSVNVVYSKVASASPWRWSWCRKIRGGGSVRDMPVQVALGDRAVRCTQQFLLTAAELGDRRGVRRAVQGAHTIARPVADERHVGIAHTGVDELVDRTSGGHRQELDAHPGQVRPVPALPVAAHCDGSSRRLR